MRKQRKPQRIISDAYQDAIRPSVISAEHWKMWLDYNGGMTNTEIAMINKTTVHDVVGIIGDIVERLKISRKDDFNDDFESVERAQAFRNRIRHNVELAVLSGESVVTIMSEV